MVQAEAHTHQRTESDDHGQSLTETVSDVIETAREGDRILFNDRVQPLTVTRRRGPYDGRNGFDYLNLEGPRGGTYKLTHRYGSRRGDSATLRRQTGYDDDGIPAYTDVQLESVELVAHHQFAVGQVFADHAIDGESDHYVVVTGFSDGGCYNANTVNVRVRHGDVASVRESGLFNKHAKERIFAGELEHVRTLDIGYGRGRTHYHDGERDEEVWLSDPHKRGVDCRPVDGSGLEVVDWETMLFGFEERFTPSTEFESNTDDAANTEESQ